MSIEEKADIPPAKSGLGTYVHVPFCATRCDFCAFYEEAPTVERIAWYFEGMELEWALVGGDWTADTMFWGGGTPGALSAKDLLRLGRPLREQLNGKSPEWSVEMTPVTVTEARLEILRDLGVNRISLGVQSFQDGLIRALGRRHNAGQVYRAYERLRKAGFTNINFDMMFALPGQGMEEWLRDLEEAFALGPEHISTYCLTLEEDTALWLRMGGRKPNLEHEADFYERTWDRLEEKGYRQYEISNFSKPGFECRHNLNTWRMGEWIGMGPSAASQFQGERGGNVPDLKRWLGALREGRRMTEDRQCLSESLLAEDSLVFGLRMNEGVDLDALRRRFPSLNWPYAQGVLDDLVQSGLMQLIGGRVLLSRKGRLLTDAVGESLLTLFDESF